MDERPGQPVVELNQVHKRFGSIEAVRGVSFIIKQGELVALLGPNGAGKTTPLPARPGQEVQLAQPSPAASAV